MTSPWLLSLALASAGAPQTPAPDPVEAVAASEPGAALPVEAEGEDEAAQTADVVLETDMGAITIRLETRAAPITAGNFLRYVDEGRFDGTVFYRAMRVDWGEQPNGLLQGGTQWDPDRVLPGIAHEATTMTGLSHTRGAVSMAMGEPGTANGDFSIMLGDQTGLDANPQSDDPVWQNGYAVFGYVIDGMDVVEVIHASPIDPAKGEGWMVGQMLAEPVTIIAARRAEPAGDTAAVGEEAGEASAQDAPG
ncbi:peptidylprolyl isomerase [Qipengyuania nanhaisediminis]|uniref:peptidylprolyl isomerase n=1 Tax=Qipengyuania nanhaisediminis TaxID=604088 RepID=UPI0038B2D383